MIPHTQFLTSPLPPIHSLHLSKPIYGHKPRFNPPKPLRCSVSVATEPPRLQSTTNKPFPAEVSRTIMELSSVGTFSTLTNDDWPLAFGVQFAVDPQGLPVVCLNASHKQLASGKSSTLHVQVDQCGMRTAQCTIQGTLDKPGDEIVLKKLQSLWEKRFGEKVDINFVHILSVERVLHMENFMEDGVWVTPADYTLANPDPLRNYAGRLVEEINTHNLEDILRFCNIYVDSDVQVSQAKMVWVDRLGFDLHIHSPQKDVFEVRIPFPREVTDEKGVKSAFNNMSQLAWEVEKNYHVPEFEKVKQLKKIARKAV